MNLNTETDWTPKSCVVQSKLTLHGIYPGVSISVEKLNEGPPAGYPVNIELQGKDYDELISTAEDIRVYLNSKNIPFIEELKINVNKSKPSMQVVVDRQKAGELGVAVGQVGNQLRRSLFGEKAGVYKLDGEDYDINVRFNQDIRFDKNALFNQNIIFRDQASGQIKEIPVSAVASQRNSSGFSSIKHRNGNRVVTVYSGLKAGGNPAQVVGEVIKEMENFKGIPESVRGRLHWEIEEQNKQMEFLVGAFFGGLALDYVNLDFPIRGDFKTIDYHDRHFPEFHWSIWRIDDNGVVFCNHDDHDGYHFTCRNRCE